MKTIATSRQGIRWLTLCIAVILAFGACRAFALTPPSECIGGLTPGVDTLRDAEDCFGGYSAVVPGDATYYAGGGHATRAYLWSNGNTISRYGLTVETSMTSQRIESVMVDMYPGIGTSCDLMALDAESCVIDQYGFPAYAFEIRVKDTTFRELFYLDRGLIIILGQLSGRPNWTVTRMIVTYPTYLRNAIAKRAQYARGTRDIIDITYSYRVWARMALPPQ